MHVHWSRCVLLVNCAIALEGSWTTHLPGRHVRLSLLCPNYARKLGRAVNLPKTPSSGDVASKLRRSPDWGDDKPGRAANLAVIGSADQTADVQFVAGTTTKRESSFRSLRLGVLARNLVASDRTPTTTSRKPAARPIPRARRTFAFDFCLLPFDFLFTASSVQNPA